MLTGVKLKSNYIALNNSQCGPSASLPACFAIKQPVQSFSHKNDLSFKGLTSAVSQKLFKSINEIKELIDKYPKSSGVVGSIPDAWVKKIPETEREVKIKKLYSSLKMVTEKLRIDSYSAGVYKYDREKMSKDFKPKIEAASKLFHKAFVEAGIIDKEANLSLKMLGQGFHGSVFKFIVDDKPFVFKVYHSVEEKRISAKDHHDAEIETNRAAFINKITSESQYCKFYVADIVDGYMLLDFIDLKSPEPKSLLDETHIGIYYGDDGEDKIGKNLIGHYIVDYGGIVIENPLLTTNKTSRWVCKKVFSASSEKDVINNWKNLFDKASKNTIPNSNDLLLGLYSIIKFLPEREQEKSLEKIFNLNDDNLTEKFSDNIVCLPENLRVKLFNKLSIKADTDTQLKLVKSIGLLPKYERIKAIKTLSENSLTNCNTLNQLLKFNRTIALDVIALINKDADVFVEHLLRENISKLSKSKQLEVYSIVVENANRQIKGRLFYDLPRMPESIQQPILKSLLKHSDPELRSRIEKDLPQVINNFNKVA